MVALVSDPDHARSDGFVSLGVLGSALGAPIADPIIACHHARDPPHHVAELAHGPHLSCDS